MPLKVIHQGNETVVDDGATALIGSDSAASIKIVRPGISRRHAVISNDDGSWKIADAGSRNGTYLDGDKVQTISVDGPTTVYLGHPSEGEVVSLVPVVNGKAEPETTPEDILEAGLEPTQVVEEPPKPAPRAAPAAAAAGASAPARKASVATPKVSGSQTVSDVELAQLTAAIRDQISAVKGLTWSVWAMIAVTAVLIVLTLFVGILAN